MRKKILVIEDSPTKMILLSNRIRHGGYEVIAASDGATGLYKMKQEKPDLVITDIVMPGMDGFEVCRHAKAEEELKNIPIVFITSSAYKWDADKYKEAGADGFIDNPYEGNALIEEIDKFLKG